MYWGAELSHRDCMQCEIAEQRCARCSHEASGLALLYFHWLLGPEEMVSSEVVLGARPGFSQGFPPSFSYQCCLVWKNKQFSPWIHHKWKPSSASEWFYVLWGLAEECEPPHREHFHLLTSGQCRSSMAPRWDTCQCKEERHCPLPPTMGSSFISHGWWYCGSSSLNDKLFLRVIFRNLSVVKLLWSNHLLRPTSMGLAVVSLLYIHIFSNNSENWIITTIKDSRWQSTADFSAELKKSNIL